MAISLYYKRHKFPPNFYNIHFKNIILVLNLSSQKDHKNQTLLPYYAGNKVIRFGQVLLLCATKVMVIKKCPF